MNYKRDMSDEFADIREIIRSELHLWGYSASDEALDATVERILEAWGGNIMNGYA
jgi:GTP cyclohydrolase I